VFRCVQQIAIREVQRLTEPCRFAMSTAHWTGCRFATHWRYTFRSVEGVHFCNGCTVSRGVWENLRYLKGVQELHFDGSTLMWTTRDTWESFQP